MFKRVFALFFTLVLFVAIVTPVQGVEAAVSLPAEVRVALAFDDANGYLPLKTSFGISCSKGVKISYLNNNKYSSTMDFSSNARVNFYKSEDLKANAKALSTSSTLPNESQSILIVSQDVGFNGNYTIKVSANSFSSLASTNDYIDSMGKGGKYAFPYFDGSDFYVCVGGFSSSADADSMLSKIQGNNLKQYLLSTLSLANTGYVVTNSTGNILVCAQLSAGSLSVDCAATGDYLQLNSTKDVKYRGKYEVKRISGKGFQIINLVPLEQYLYSVVPSEIGSSSGAEALKAQAIIARNYAYQCMDKHKSIGADLCASVHCQEYSYGMAKEAASSTKAVDDTKGQLLLYNGTPAQCYYAASDGGATEDVKNVWGSTGFPYLISVKDPYDTSISWTKSFSFSDIKSTLSSKGVNIGDITNIVINSISPAGRPTSLTVVGTSGTKEYKNEGCRTFLGLQSQLYTISMTGIVAVDEDKNFTNIGEDALSIVTASGILSDNIGNSMYVINGDNVISALPTNSQPSTITFSGKGNGHGVGLSQIGAQNMAKQGFTYKQILEFYFPGTAVQ